MQFRASCMARLTFMTTRLESSPCEALEGRHAGIRKRGTGATFAQGRLALGMRQANAPHEQMEIAEFNRRLILKHLNEIAVPVQP